MFSATVPVEQLDVLRHIADVAADASAVEIGERGAVQPNLAGQDRPGADQRARQRRLAGRARTDHAERLSRRQCERHPLEHRPDDAGRRHEQVGHDDFALGAAAAACAAGGSPCLRNVLAQTAIGRARGREAAPGGDRALHRRQRSRHDNRSGDHGAGRDGAVDRQPGADRQDRDLQKRPPELGDRDEDAGAVGNRRVAVHALAVSALPALKDRRPHAHRDDDLGVPQGLIGNAGGCDGLGGCRLRKPPGRLLVPQRHHQQDEAPTSATSPSSGCSRKVTAMKIGAQGASNSTGNALPLRNVRSVSRSRSG